MKPCRPPTHFCDLCDKALASSKSLWNHKQLCPKNMKLVGSMNINTERFEMIYLEIERTFWSVVKNVFMKMVNLKVNIPYAIESVTLYIECCPL